jgi:hypothetical protein
MKGRKKKIAFLKTGEKQKGPWSCPGFYLLPLPL